MQSLCTLHFNEALRMCIIIMKCDEFTTLYKNAARLAGNLKIKIIKNYSIFLKRNNKNV